MEKHESIHPTAEIAGNQLAKWPSFNTRDLLIAMALVGIGSAWPVHFMIMAPAMVAGILFRVKFASPAARLLCTLGTLYPAAFLSLVYLAWTIAWEEVGRRAIPSHDDPSHIAPLVSAVYSVAAVTFFGLPVAFILGVVSQVLRLDKGSPAWASALAHGGGVFLGVWIAFFLLCAADPGQAIEWFFD